MTTDSIKVSLMGSRCRSALQMPRAKQIINAAQLLTFFTNPRLRARQIINLSHHPLHVRKQNISWRY